MADKAISELVAATQVTPTDLFVLEQAGSAKKLTGQILENWLVSFANGHGGIQNIRKISTNVLVDTYRITLADTTVFDFTVTNGKGISSITRTSTSGLVNTYTIRYNDNSSSTFTVTNGAKGDKGDNAYLWIKYASQEPTEESNYIGDLPDDWIGIYAGNLAEAPTNWRLYSWYKIKGEQGDTGEPATLVSASVNYQVGESGTIIPSGSWREEIPVVAQGKYLWTRIVQTFNTGEPVKAYTVARMGIDGLGSVVSVCGKSPNANGNVSLNAADVDALPIGGGDMTGNINMNGQRLYGLNPPVDQTDAISKGYADSTYTQITVLWENESPASTFVNHTFPLDLSGYKGIFVIYLAKIGANGYASSGFIPVDGVTYCASSFPSDSGAQFKRSCLAYSGSVRFGPGTQNGTEDNTLMIPIKIYGVT